MGVKVYISGISGNKEVKKRQQRVLMILDSRNIQYTAVDITEPGREADRDFMQEKSTSLGATVSDLSPRHPLPPQLFNDDEYCGDYDQFDLANENDEIDKFFKFTPADDVKVSNAEITLGNGTAEAAVEVDSSEPAGDETEVVAADSTEPEAEVDSTEKQEEVESEPENAEETEEAEEDSSKLPDETADDAA